MDIDDAIDRFAAAVERAGGEPVRPPDDSKTVGGAMPVGVALAEIERQIAPLVLPVAARRTWERIHPWGLRVGMYPELQTAEMALMLWQSNIDNLASMVPRPLFPLFYESHNFLFVDLDDADSTGGGALWEWGYGGSIFKLRAYQVADWFESLAEVIEGGGVSRRGGNDRLQIDMDLHHQKVSDRLAHASPHPIYGQPQQHPVYTYIGYSITVEEDIRAWPSRWRLLSGINDDDLVPRGATHSVAELLDEADRAAERQGGEVRATIVGEVVGIRDSSLGVEVTVDDGTSQVPVWCPARIALLGPYGPGRFEFDVVLKRGDQARRASMQREAMKPLTRVVARALGAYGTMSDAAIADAIRPLPESDDGELSA